MSPGQGHVPRAAPVLPARTSLQLSSGPSSSEGCRSQGRQARSLDPLLHLTPSAQGLSWLIRTVRVRVVHAEVAPVWEGLQGARTLRASQASTARKREQVRAEKGLGEDAEPEVPSTSPSQPLPPWRSKGCFHSAQPCRSPPLPAGSAAEAAAHPRTQAQSGWGETCHQQEADGAAG